MTVKELQERCGVLARAYAGHVSLTFEDGYVTATLTRDKGLVCCCRATLEEAISALEEVVPQSIAVIGTGVPGMN